MANETTKGRPQVVLETERLWLTKLSANEDAAFILALVNTPAWLSFIGDRGVKTLEEARQYILNGPVHSYTQFGFGSYLVKLKSDGVSVGMCGLLKRDFLNDVDIGFAFLPEYVGQGYGYEAAIAVMTYARETFGATQIAGITHPANHLSIRLLEKLGFRFERSLPRADGVECLLFRTPTTHLS